MRNAPVPHCTHTARDYYTTDILPAECVYQVLFRGAPFGIRTENFYKNIAKKYPRTTYPSRRAATKLAEKLNKLFHCDDFTVREVV